MLEFAGLAAALAALEGAARLHYRRRRGKPFGAPDAAQSATSAAAETFSLKQVVFHPYLGYVNHPQRRDAYAANNQGFQVGRKTYEADPEAWDYPRARRGDEVLVGVFGGSVALGFSMVEHATGMFARHLGALPQFAGRTVTVLNFAVSGFKQPQQALALAYALAQGQQFDIVINVDGFNEIINTLLNQQAGMEPSYPAHVIWKSMGSYLEQARMPLLGGGGAQALLHAHKVNLWQARAQAQRRLAVGFVLCRAMMRYHRIRRDLLLGSGGGVRPDESWFPASPHTPNLSGRDIYEAAAEIWRESSRMMAALMRGRGAYVHVLQPCQWLRDVGEYIPLDPEHAYKWVVEPINRGYPFLRRGLSALGGAGVGVLDASTLFRGRLDAEHFVDDCAHLTDHGYDLLYEAVVRTLEACSRAAQTPCTSPP